MKKWLPITLLVVFEFASALDTVSGPLLERVVTSVDFRRAFQFAGDCRGLDMETGVAWITRNRTDVEQERHYEQLLSDTLENDLSEAGLYNRGEPYESPLVLIIINVEDTAYAVTAEFFKKGLDVYFTEDERYVATWSDLIVGTHDGNLEPAIEDARLLLKWIAHYYWDAHWMQGGCPELEEQEAPLEYTHNQLAH